MKKYFSALLLFPLANADLTAAPLKTDVSAGYTYDDNVTRAELDDDIEKDSILNVDASASYLLPFNDISYFSVKGTLGINQYQDFTKLSNTRLGIHGSYHLRPSTGYTATRYFVRLTYESRMYDSDQRDGSATEIGLGLSKRLTDLLSLRAGYIKQDVSADSVVFDADNKRFYLDLDYRVSAKNTLYVTLASTDGDVVSTAVPNANIILYSSAIDLDDAFLNLLPNRFAYKLDAKTTSIRIGDSFAFASNQAVDVSLLKYDSDAGDYNSYTGMIVNLNYFYRF